MLSRTYNTTMAIACGVLILVGVLCIAYGASAADLRVPTPVPGITPDATLTADVLGECRFDTVLGAGETRVVRCAAAGGVYPWPLSAQASTGSRTVQAWLLQTNGAWADVAVRNLDSRAARVQLRVALSLAVPAGPISPPVAAIGHHPLQAVPGASPAPFALAATVPGISMPPQADAVAVAGPEMRTPAAGTAGVL